jgi:hypothetical protein
VLHVHPASTTATPKALAPILAKARLATTKYATSLQAARRDGYTVTVTRHIPDMGWHFLNPKVAGFDASKPPILVYAKRGKAWHLVAFEWVFPEKPAKPPLPAATYGSFAAACHYADGTFVLRRPRPTARRRAPRAAPPSGSGTPTS